MKRIIWALLACLASSAAFAHPGHGDPITEEVAVQRATAEMTRLIDAGKLDRSWKLNSTLSSAKLADKQGAKEWTVVFANEKAAGKERQLFVFLTDQGEYVAANFSGR